MKRKEMSEVIMKGPEGRLEGQFYPAQKPNSPLAMILHPHPERGGSMNNKVVYQLYQTFVNRGFATLRFNFRGVGRSQGVYDRGEGELSDAASALDWLQTVHTDAPQCWIAGFSFGAWIGMQLLMRRPEINGFISIAPPANMYDFSFLAPCPASGLVIHGDKDEIVPPESIDEMIAKVAKQRDVVIQSQIIEGANHFFGNELEQVETHVTAYLDRRMPEIEKKLTNPDDD
jgi:hypothetical protein